MTISFNTIPTTNRVPLFYAEVDSSAAGTTTILQNSLLVGQKMAIGSATKETQVRIMSAADAAGKFGQGSMMHRMAKAYLANDPGAFLYGIALDDASGTQASGTVAFTGTSTEAGTCWFRVDDYNLSVGVASSTTAAALAEDLRDVINGTEISLTSGAPVTGQLYQITAHSLLDFTTVGSADSNVGTVFTATSNGLTLTAADSLKPINTDYPVYATFSTGTLTCTAKHKGAVGNSIKISLNLFGAVANEALPAGLTATVTGMASGATDPALTNVITAMGETEFDFIIHPYCDTSNLNLLKTEMESRWAYNRMIYGVSFTAKKDSSSDLLAFGALRNNPYEVIPGYEETAPVSLDVFIAGVVGKAAPSIKNSPSRPLQTLQVSGITGPAADDAFLYSERNAHLYDGISTVNYAPDRSVKIERLISTYQVDGNGTETDAWLDIMTHYTLMYILRDSKARIERNFGRKILVDDLTKVSPGVAACSAGSIKAELIAAYSEYEEMGLVENGATFAANLIVERNALNPNRVDIFYPPDLANQLMMVALLNQYRLQY